MAMEPQGREQQMPRSVRNAVNLMYAGAGVNALVFLLGLISMDDSRAQTADQLRSLGYGPSMVESMTDAAMGGALAGGVIGVGLWVWMAVKNRQGRNWARIVGTVFFGVESLIMLVVLPGIGADPIGSLLTLLVWLLGLGAVVFMWRGESAPHYAPRAPQPPPIQQH